MNKLVLQIVISTFQKKKILQHTSQVSTYPEASHRNRYMYLVVNKIYQICVHCGMWMQG